MTTKTFNSIVLRRVKEILNKLPKDRHREIIERRFGLNNGNRETLEAIGRDHGITRERVRQIERDAIKKLSQKETFLVLNPIFEELNRVFKEYHYVISEERLLSLLTGFKGPCPEGSAVILVLTLGKPYQRFNNCERFYPHWTTNNEAREKAIKVIDDLIEYFREERQTIDNSKAIEIVLSKNRDIPQKLAENALEISKEISRNVFNEIGLKDWPEINPKGVQDKAYLVLKKENKPHHFTKITDLINKYNFSPHQALVQTVHNELIKNERFVLIGRGIYALREWGYEPGTVKDILIKILSNAKRPLKKSEIVSSVLKERKVKVGTITVNLQGKEFNRLKDGRYILSKNK